jgi:hypothetical protein
MLEKTVALTLGWRGYSNKQTDYGIAAEKC